MSICGSPQWTLTSTLRPLGLFKLLVFSTASPGPHPQVSPVPTPRDAFIPLGLYHLFSLAQQHFLLLGTLQSFSWKNLSQIQLLGISADCLLSTVIFIFMPHVLRHYLLRTSSWSIHWVISQSLMEMSTRKTSFTKPGLNYIPLAINAYLTKLLR